MEGSIVDTRDGRRRPFRWQPGSVVFGSGVEADLVLPDPAIAARHGTFEVTATGCRMKLEPGVTPVQVNGAFSRESEIAVGDVVKIGPFQLALSGAATAASPEAAAPAAAAKPAAAPSRRPAAATIRGASSAARYSGAARVRTGAPGRAVHASHEDDDAESGETRGAARYRAVMAGKGSDARTWLVGLGIFFGIVLLGAIFIFGGKPYAHLGDESFPEEQRKIQQLVGKCEFDAAFAHIKELEGMTDDTSVQNKLIDLRHLVTSAQNEFKAGEAELQRIRNSYGKRETYYLVKDDIPLFQHNYNQFPPLVKAADELLAELTKGRAAASTAPPTASDADLAPGKVAPAFDKRNEHGKQESGGH